MTTYKILVWTCVLFVIAIPSVVGAGSAIVSQILSQIGSTAQNALLSGVLFYFVDAVRVWYG